MRRQKKNYLMKKWNMKMLMRWKILLSMTMENPSITRKKHQFMNLNATMKMMAKISLVTFMTKTLEDNLSHSL